MSTSRHCYVYGCANGDYRLLRWSNDKCKIHSCFLGTESCDCEPPFRLYPFPSAKKEPEKRRAWLLLMKRGDQENKAKLQEPSSKHRVCSQHFQDGAPTDANPNPTLNLGYKRAPKVNEVDTPRAKRRKEREDRHREASHETPSTFAEPPPEPEPTVPPTSDRQPPKPAVFFCVLSFIVSVLLSLWRKTTPELKRVKEENSKLRKELRRLQKQVLSLKSRSKQNFGTSNLKTDSDVRFYTGLKNFSYFNTLHDSVVKFVRRRWTGLKNSVRKGRKFMSSPKKFGPKTKLRSCDELLLCLMKLRLGLLNRDLACRFGISVSLCTQIFNSWLTALSQTFGRTVKWYPKEHINATLPQRFRCLPNLRGIIDCSEIPMETPKSMILQNVTWSSYKHHNTAKFLICIAPDSMITFLSPVYGGRSSDKKVVETSGFLDLLEDGDMVMADKGFNIQEGCLARFVELYAPPGKRGVSQMSVAAVNKTKRIANLRILVEQVIRRLKTFRILKYELPISLLPSLDKMLAVCAALSNLMGPIYET